MVAEGKPAFVFNRAGTYFGWFVMIFFWGFCDLGLVVANGPPRSFADQVSYLGIAAFGLGGLWLVLTNRTVRFYAEMLEISTVRGTDTVNYSEISQVREFVRRSRNASTLWLRVSFLGDRKPVSFGLGNRYGSFAPFIKERLPTGTYYPYSTGKDTP